MREGTEILASWNRTMAGARVRALRCAALALAAISATSACSGSMDGDETHKINGSVHVAAGRPAGSAEAVNGSIHIDDNAAVTKASSVNGGIHLGAHATADSLKSVNGSITIDTGAHVAHAVEAVNGAIKVREQAEVLGRLANVSGDIELAAAHVAGGIATVAGNISVMGASRVEGGIRIEKPSSSLIQIGTTPRIVIGPGATVQGELRFEREVHLYVSDHATIGTVSGATPVPFQGDSPPN